MNNSQVGHAWYYDGNRTNGDTPRNKNFFYNGDTIYSYGSHYPIARKVRHNTGDFHILMTVDAMWWPTCSSYSSTTAKHVSIAHQAIPSNTLIIFVENPAAESKEAHLLNYRIEMDRVTAILKLISKGRDGSGAQNDRVSAIHQIVAGMNQYTRLHKLGKRQIDAANLFDPGRLQRIKNSKKRLAAKKKKERAAADLRAIEHNKEVIADWINGHDVNHFPYSIRKVYLRIKGDNIETSQGAAISIEHAKKLFSFVCNVCQKKESFKPRHFGPFELLKVDDDCTIKIGCHTIEMDEMQRINDLLK